MFDKKGAVVAVAQKEFKQIYPQPGWVEHDPNEIWYTQVSVAAEAVVKAGLSVKDIITIGITNQRETTIVWDRETHEPIHNAIVWQDRRTAAFCDELRSNGSAKGIQEKTGLFPVFMSMKQPVPYVFFTMPAFTHICPNNAAC